MSHRDLEIEGLRVVLPDHRYHVMQVDPDTNLVLNDTVVEAMDPEHAAGVACEKWTRQDPAWFVEDDIVTVHVAQLDEVAEGETRGDLSGVRFRVHLEMVQEYTTEEVGPAAAPLMDDDACAQREVDDGASQR